MKVTFYALRPLFLFLILFLSGHIATAQGTIVGNAGFSAGFAFQNTLAFDSQKHMYVAYSDAGLGQRIVVKKLIDGIWTTQGNAGFAGGQGGQSCSMVLSSDDIPYVATIGGPDLKASVWKLTGAVWEMVGTEVSEEIAGSVEIAMNSNDVPYVLYRDEKVYTGVSGGKATVKKFNGLTWEVVGAPAFSDDFIQSQDIAIDGNDVPYVAYEDGGHSSSATVKKFDGTSWQPVGNAGFNGGFAKFISLAIDGNNVPYLAFRDGNKFNRANCFKFNTVAWETVGGTTGLSPSPASYISLAIDQSNKLLIAYTLEDTPYSASLKKFDGTSWKLVGAEKFSGGSAAFTSLVMDTNDNPFLAFQDGANGSRETVSTFQIFDPLPVRLVSFEGKYSNSEKAIVLDWITSEEIRNDRFEIEARNAESAFRKIAEVKGAGNNNGDAFYSFTDRQSTGNIVYYRLKQIDYDGTFTYSKIISVHKPGNEDFFIAGNPVPDNILRIHTGSASPENVQINLFNVGGKAFGHWKLMQQEQLEIDVKNLASGSYILRYENANGVQNRKFIRE